VLVRVRAANTWKEKQERIEAIEETLRLGSDPSTELPMSLDDLEALERELANHKSQLRSIEEAAIDRDHDATKAKQAWQSAQDELDATRRKIDPKQIDRSPDCQRAKSELDQASRKMQSATTAMDRSSNAVRKKARELGSDYTAYLKAKKADAADPNRNKSTPSKKR
jgi:chromosome segregation ATPase